MKSGIEYTVNTLRFGGIVEKFVDTRYYDWDKLNIDDTEWHCIAWYAEYMSAWANILEKYASLRSRGYTHKVALENVNK